jgi:hypothetical protein
MSAAIASPDIPRIADVLRRTFLSIGYPPSCCQKVH